MSGWKRLYIFTVLLISIPAIGIWYVDKPPSPYKEYLSSCYETSNALEKIRPVKGEVNPFNYELSITATDASKRLTFIENGVDIWKNDVQVYFSEKGEYTLDYLNKQTEFESVLLKDKLVSSSKVEFEKCKAELKDLESGRLEVIAGNEWIADLKNGAGILAIFFAVIYLLGWGLGWVWRGFRKPKL